MIYLDTTAKKLEIDLAGAVSANQLQISCHFYDELPQSGPQTTDPLATGKRAGKGGNTNSLSNSTTDATLVAAPVIQGIVRNIHTIFVYNADTASATVIIKIDDGGTETILVRRTLLTLQTLAYEHGVGWYYMSVT